MRVTGPELNVCEFPKKDEARSQSWRKGMRIWMRRQRTRMTRLENRNWKGEIRDSHPEPNRNDHGGKMGATSCQECNKVCSIFRQRITWAYFRQKTLHGSFTVMRPSID